MDVGGIEGKSGKFKGKRDKSWKSPQQPWYKSGGKSQKSKDAGKKGNKKGTPGKSSDYFNGECGFCHKWGHTKKDYRKRAALLKEKAKETSWISTLRNTQFGQTFRGDDSKLYKKWGHAYPSPYAFSKAMENGYIFFTCRLCGPQWNPTGPRCSVKCEWSNNDGYY